MTVVRLDLFTVGCFEDDFDFPLRELCVVADEVDVSGPSTGAPNEDIVQNQLT